MAILEETTQFKDNKYRNYGGANVRDSKDSKNFKDLREGEDVKVLEERAKAATEVLINKDTLQMEKIDKKGMTEKTLSNPTGSSKETLEEVDRMLKNGKSIKEIDEMITESKVSE